MTEKNATSSSTVLVSPDRFELMPQIKEECVVQITNVSFESIMFYFRTTSPESYLVKSRKGVIKANSVANVTIVLNRETIKNEPKTNSLKHDDFRIEYATVGANDVVEPNAANISALIKAKKAADRSLVRSKFVRCTLNLSGRAQDHANGQANSKQPLTNEHGSGGQHPATMDPRELEQNTLAEKNRREKAKQAKGKRKTLILLGIAGIVAFFAIWLMYGKQEMEEVTPLLEQQMFEEGDQLLK